MPPKDVEGLRATGCRGKGHVKRPVGHARRKIARINSTTVVLPLRAIRAAQEQGRSKPPPLYVHPLTQAAALRTVRQSPRVLVCLCVRLLMCWGPLYAWKESPMATPWGTWIRWPCNACIAQVYVRLMDAWDDHGMPPATILESCGESGLPMEKGMERP